MGEWTFTIAYAGLFISLLYMSGEHISDDVLAPGIVWPILLYLYMIASGLYATEAGATFFGYPVDDEIMSTFYWSGLVGLAGFFLGGAMSRRWLVRLQTLSLHSIECGFEKKLFVYAAIAAILLSPFIVNSFNVFHQESYRDRALSMRVEMMQDSEGGIKNVFLVGMPVTLIICACCTVLFDVRRRAIWRTAALAIIGLNVGANVLAGWRNNVMATIGILAIYYHYRVRKLRLGVLIIGGLISYLIVSTMPILRVSSDPVEMYNSLRDEIGANALAFLALNRSGELLTGTNLMRQIGGMRDRETHYSFGSTVIDDILVFIPRPLYPNRPLPSAERFVDVFYPGVRETGGGYGFFILQEGNWVGGYLGILVMMALFGYVVYSAYWTFRRLIVSDWILFGYAVMFPDLCVFSVRIGVIGTIKAALLHFVPLLVLAVAPVLTFDRTTAIADPSSVGVCR